MSNTLLGRVGRHARPAEGADPATVEVLEARLRDWAAELEVASGRSVTDSPGAGAAGGLGAALLALGGKRESGAALIAAHTGTPAEVAAADLVVTGEGRLDDQSLHGKVVGALATEARGRGAGRGARGSGRVGAQQLLAAGITAAHSLSEYAGSVERAISDASGQLMGLARRTAADLPGE